MDKTSKFKCSIIVCQNRENSPLLLAHATKKLSLYQKTKQKSRRIENICQKRGGVNGKTKFSPKFLIADAQTLSDFIFLKIPKIFAKRVGPIQ
jgi:hypothetical protein